MIADALKYDVEQYAAAMPESNALYFGATDGRLTAEMVSYYLFNVRHLLQHTPLHLTRARAHALALGDHALASHLLEKFHEEQGHDRWAEADLERLRQGFEVQGFEVQDLDARAGDTLSPGLVGLIRFVERTIDEDPTLYLAYMLFAEYLIALMGPSWLALIEERCRIPASMLSVISKHAELDVEHSSESFEAIDALVGDPTKVGPMRAVLRETFVHFDRFSADVLTVLASSTEPSPDAW